MREICTPGSDWGDEIKRLCSLGEAPARKRLRREAPHGLPLSRLVSTILVERIADHPINRVHELLCARRNLVLPVGEIPTPARGQPPHWESSLESEEVTNRIKRRQSDERAVTKVKRSSLVINRTTGRQRSSCWQAPVGSPSMARWPETVAGSKSTARSDTEALWDLGDPLRSCHQMDAGRVCRTIGLTPEKDRCCSAKSDSLVVLRARESRVHGEATKQMKTGSRDTSPAPTEAGF